MELSIIIVNYNVKYFLEQCLCSVERAVHTAGAAVEIFVVDNHSSDGSAEWLPTRFPQVQFILNSDNNGFGAANNQALARAKGEYILFLNPDTILPEDCLSICLAFMRSTPQAGAAGVRMIDGSGHFLKESMRGFPTPWVAFCKMSGLTSLFPHSRLFAGYYQGHLFPMKDHPSPILSGAYMFVRKQALDKTGGFDERFFLYAEDIDLSYRIQQAGYINYYLSRTTILHFKGESTPKDARHIMQFYEAMAKFRRKYFRSSFFRRNLIPSSFFIDVAIWGKAGLQVMKNAFKPGVDRMSNEVPIWVCGDDQEAARIKTLLSGLKAAIAPKPENAGEIIFCEGPNFSFKEIISSLELGMPGQRTKTYKIHAKGTVAAVGSSYKWQQGEVIKI